MFPGADIFFLLMLECAEAGVMSSPDTTSLGWEEVGVRSSRPLVEGCGDRLFNPFDYKQGDV